MLELDPCDGVLNWDDWVASLPSTTRAAIETLESAEGRHGAATRRPIPDGAYLTLREVARLLRVSQGKVLGWIKCGRIRAVDVGRAGRPAYRIDREALANSLQAAVEPQKVKRRPRARPGFIEKY